MTSNVEDAGDHVAKMKISLADYDVSPIYVEIPVTINPCVIANFLDTTETIISPINQILELPTQQSFDMPLYEPDPLCGYSDQDVNYQLLTNANGQPPSWISIDASKHKIVLDVEEDESLYGEDFSFKLKATFQSFEEV